VKVEIAKLEWFNGYWNKNADLDLIYQPTNFIAFVSNLRSWRALRETVAAFKAHADFPCESLAGPAIVPDCRGPASSGAPAMQMVRPCSTAIPTTARRTRPEAAIARWRAW
jgi:hypothetical protein